MELYVREAVEGDLEALLRLYTYLHDNPFPDMDDGLKFLWQRIMSDPNHHILLGYEDSSCGESSDKGEPVSSCVVVVVENLTHGRRPYALVENVITHPAHRNRGYASAVLESAKKIAVESGCYKIMLMTGSKEKSTLDFYRKAGYNSEDKTAFIQWL